MIILYLNIERISCHPFETNSPLLANADAVLPVSISFQGFQSVSGRHAQVFETNRSVQKLQLMKSLLLNVAWQLFGKSPLPDLMSFDTFKMYDQLR